MTSPPWRLHAALAWPAPAAGRAALGAVLAALRLPAPFVGRVLDEVDGRVAQARRRAADAAVSVRVLINPEAAAGARHALWGFFCLERRPAAADYVLELFLYPEL